MDQQQRFSSFFGRVETEREILRVVNSALCAKDWLNGLSAAAIERWHNREGLRPEPTAGEVKQLLLQLASALNADADQSRLVFDGDSFEPSTSVSHLLLQLQNTISRLREGG
jgi:hypothetical protein